MIDNFEKSIVRLDEESLDALDRRLTIAVSKLTPGEYLTVRGPGGESQLQVSRQTELKEVKSEIIENCRHGVKIASHAESTPLIPLFEAAKVELPVELKVAHEQMGYNFYWVEVLFSSILDKDQFLLSAEFGLTLTDDVKDPARRTRAIRLFPERKDIQLFNIDLEGAVGIDANMNVSVPIAGSDVIPFAKVNADANTKLKSGIVAGPFKFIFRKAAVEVIGQSDQNILWRYNLQSELSGNNEFKSALLLKIAEEASSVQMSAFLEVVPCKHRWIVLKDVLPKLTLPPPGTMTLPVELVTRRI